MRARSWWVGIASALAACNGLNGVSDLHEVDCVECGDAATPNVDAGSGPVTQDGAATPARDQSAPDGGTGADVLVPAPSYCSGLVFNAPFDDNPNSIAGQIPSTNDSAGLVPGKFKNAASLPAGAIFYESPFISMATTTTLHNKDLGSVALWFRPNFVLKVGDKRPIYKPRTGQGAGANNSGPGIAIEGLEMHMYNQDGVAASATLSSDKVASVWTPAGFMLVVGTWNRTGAAAVSTLTITLASSLGSASAGTNAPWTPANDVAKFVRFGSQDAASASLLDDASIWNRQLTDKEISDLYAASVGVAAACGK